VRIARLAVLVSPAIGAGATPLAARENPGDRAIVATFVEAVNRGGPARLPLVHPATRACNSAEGT